MDINFIAKIVAYSVGVQIDAILSTSKGSPLIARCRAIVAYIASTEMCMTDIQIAKLLKRDRSTISHAVAVIENLREISEFDEYIENLTRQAFNPPLITPAARTILETAQERDVITDRISFKTCRNNNYDLMPPKIKAIINRVAQIHDVKPYDIFSDKNLRNEAIIAMAKERGVTGARLYPTRRIAPFFKLHHTMVARIIKGAGNSERTTW